MSSSKSKEKKEKKSSKKDKSSKKEKKSKKSKTDASREGSSSTPSPKLGRDPTGQCYLPSIKEWLASKSNSEHIEYVKTDKDEKRFLFTIGSDKLKFEVTYPVDADDVWSVSSDDLTEDWVNETLENVLGAKKIEEVLLYATQQFSALSGSDEGSGSDKGSDDEENEDEDGWEDEMFSKVDTKAPKKSYTPDPIIDTSKFHIPSGYEAGAVQSIIQQYREILKTDRAERGYDAAPLANNIAQWEIKLFGIAKDEPLYKDMQQQGLDHITLHVTFPPNFPFGPPFIRVVRPRFAFRTGHVTMGGSICTLVLTNDGWVATYRLDQVLVDIRAMLTSGGGRLDMGNRSDYTEDEAMVAFRRMLDTHGWKHWKY